MIQANIYSPAIIGTIFSVTEAILFIPPKNTNPAKIDIITPTNRGDTPKALLKATEIELACTAFPIRPRAKIQATEKKIANPLESHLFFKEFSI